MGRREHIDDAGIRLIAHGEVHAPIHLQADAEVSLPRGSTFYYARTRRDLLALVVNRPSGGPQADIDDLEIPASISRREAAEIVIGVLEYTVRRADVQAAHGALLSELRDDVELRELLAAEASVRQPLTHLVERVLLAAGVNQASAYAPDPVGLVGALLIYQAAKVALMDARRVLRVHLEGFD